MNALKTKLPARWRYIKTIFLALAATACLVWSAIYTFDVDSGEILSYFWLSLVLLLVLVVLSLLGAGIMVIARKWRDY
ncbi:MAG: hypothetical protein ACR2P1_06450 [Pseudomonadales bacterium]